ncbi:MFS-type transporter SLC18B1 [Geodia barretti]|uniref:MFS-type transporter SLC18B1 n=1 Tax=Geodia barretti TaxID=519541 RepID=A0AA35X919_GEOBA|nr:MFS-type transporter SLC18B1 [Geodia barretti]
MNCRFRMASEIFAFLRCKQCVRAADTPVARHADFELRALTEEDGNKEEPSYTWRRNVLIAALLSTITFFVASAYSMVASFFPIEAAEMGSNSITTGVIIGVSPLCLATLSPVIGYFLPKLGTKMILISGQVLVGGAFFLMAFLAYMPSSTSFVVYGILLRVTEGVGWAMSNTTIIALIPVLFPSRVGTLTGLIFGAIGLGYTAGPPLGSILVVAAGYSAPFWIVGGIILCLAPVTFLLLKETSTSSKVLPFQIVIKLLSHLSFSMIQIAGIVGYGSLTFQEAALSVYLLNEIGLNLLEIGIYFAVIAVSYTLITVVAGLLSDKFGPRTLIITGLFICGASLMVLGLNQLPPIPPRWTILISLALVGCGAALAGVPAYSDLLQQAQ